MLVLNICYNDLWKFCQCKLKKITNFVMSNLLFFLFLNIEVLPGQFEKKYKLHVFEVIKREIITEETKTIRLL